MINLSGVRSSAVENLEMAHGISEHSIGNAEQLLLLDDRLGELGAGLDVAKPRERGVEMVGNPLVDLVDDRALEIVHQQVELADQGAPDRADSRPPRPRDRLDYPLHIPGLLPGSLGDKNLARHDPLAQPLEILRDGPLARAVAMSRGRAPGATHPTVGVRPPTPAAAAHPRTAGRAPRPAAASAPRGRTRRRSAPPPPRPPA